MLHTYIQTSKMELFAKIVKAVRYFLKVWRFSIRPYSTVTHWSPVTAA